jgi:hypothetical protein
MPYYHVAPQSVRAAIAADEALWAAGGEDYEGDSAEFGVYLFDNLRDAQRFLAWAGKEYPETHAVCDIWVLELEADDKTALETDPLEPGGWMLPEQGLWPVSLDRHQG